MPVIQSIKITCLAQGKTKLIKVIQCAATKT